MPAAIIGVALVGSGVVAAATVGYIALGITVVGMVTKNPKLMKIGGQLGLGAGIASIATSFMGAGASAASSATSGVGEVASAAAEDAAMMGVAAPSGQWGSTAAGAFTEGVVPFKADAPVQMSDINAPVPPAPQVTAPPVDRLSKFNDLSGSGIDTGAVAAPGTTQGTTQGLTKTLGDTQGANVGGDLGNQTVRTANDSGSQVTKPDRGFLENIFGSDSKPLTEQEARLASDRNKYMMMEGGKIIAGGVQGLATTSNANAQLEENRRVDDQRRANAGSIGRSNYGLMRPK